MIARRNSCDKSVGSKETYTQRIITHIQSEYVRRRSLERSLSTGITECSSPEICSNEVISEEIPLLTVENVEFYPKDNAKEHHTDKYKLVQDPVQPKPVLRRGQIFRMTVSFDRKYDPNMDTVKLIFSFGPEPSETRGTRVVLLLDQAKVIKPDHTVWNLKLMETDGLATDLSLLVQIPAIAQVGVWSCMVTTKTRYMNEVIENDYSCPEEIYIIFNPWCKDDTVYVEDDSWRKEYVLNDVGRLYLGSYNSYLGRTWKFGQFEDIVLPTSIYLLNKPLATTGEPFLHYNNRGDPIKMVRAISAVINAHDEGGLIAGKWIGGFAGGTPPTSWTGSVPIMEKYHENGYRPVKYGQCWVYSAVAVTVCRALGIACRSITSFQSGHDYDDSLTINMYYDENGEIDYDKSESYWNFHVWNEVWMARPDLSFRYGGWQIIDATPQGQTLENDCDSLTLCGPASKEAVFKGIVGISYDTSFVYSEVNADVYYFKPHKKSPSGYALSHVETDSISRLIVTKAIGKQANYSYDKSDVEDLTLTYKNREGSEEERLAAFNAISRNATARGIYSLPKKEVEDVSFALVDIDAVDLGKPFEVVVNIKNKSNEQRKITIVLTASSVYYIGAVAHQLKTQKEHVVVEPLKEKTVKMNVEVKEYINKLVNHNLIKMYAVARVDDTLQTWDGEDNFLLRSPKIAIEAKDLHAGKTGKVLLAFKNPLNIPLTCCSYSIEGCGLLRPKTTEFRDVKPNELVTISECIQPRMDDDHTIIVTFTSEEVPEIYGSAVLKVANSTT